jgi:hypothetical protein
VSRPLWRIVLSVILLSFGAHRVAASAIAWSSAVPREIALAIACEAAAGLVAGVCVWIGGRPAIVGVVVLGVAMAASAAMLVFVVGAAAVPAAVSRTLIAALGAVAFLAMFRLDARRDS